MNLRLKLNLQLLLCLPVHLAHLSLCLTLCTLSLTRRHAPFPTSAATGAPSASQACSWASTRVSLSPSPSLSRVHVSSEEALSPHQVLAKILGTNVFSSSGEDRVGGRSCGCHKCPTEGIKDAVFLHTQKASDNATGNRTASELSTTKFQVAQTTCSSIGTLVAVTRAGRRQGLRYRSMSARKCRQDSLARKRAHKLSNATHNVHDSR